jgi:hypothetical protein
MDPRTVKMADPMNIQGSSSISLYERKSAFDALANTMERAAPRAKIGARSRSRDRSPGSMDKSL